jgi:hypothetical protein
MDLSKEERGFENWSSALAWYKDIRPWFRVAILIREASFRVGSTGFAFSDAPIFFEVKEDSRYFKTGFGVEVYGWRYY